MAHRLLSTRVVMNRRARLQAGYSLAEMLVVLAIIGIMTLVAVPNFMSFYRSSKLKSGLRQVTTDLRSARQHAVGSNRMTKMTVNLGTTPPGTYKIFDTPDGGTTWTQVSPALAGATNSVQAPVYFSDSNIKDAGGTFVDFVFLNNGTAQLPSGTTNGTLIITTKDDIPMKSFTIKVFPTGKVSAQ